MDFSRHACGFRYAIPDSLEDHRIQPALWLPSGHGHQTFHKRFCCFSLAFSITGATTSNVIKQLKLLILVVCASTLGACNRAPDHPQRTTTSFPIDDSFENKVAALVAFVGVQTWLSQKGFEVCTMPNDQRIALFREGPLTPAKTGFWYSRGADAKAQYLLWVSLVPAGSAVHIRAGGQFTGHDGMDYDKTKSECEELLQQLQEYLDSLKAKPGG